MQLIGLRKDKDTDEIIRYELNIKRRDIACLYKDRYGVYVYTHFGRLYKVEHSLSSLEKLLCL
jgi:hypothetical protein